MRRLWTAMPLLTALSVTSLAAQALDDGQMLARRTLGVGLSYTHDGWSEYWEGSLQRTNGNVGTITTQSVTWAAAYGVTDRLSVMAMLPYVWTRASAGPLHGMGGMQDLTLAAKYRVLSTPLTQRGTLRAFVGAAAGLPVGDYTPDFLPLSIGLGSRTFSGRFTLNFQAHAGWFLNASAGYMWRGKVTLDRPAYYTDGQLYLSNEVAMPDVAQYGFTAGYQQGRLCLPVSLSWQRTQGGGDIRRQDMPFVSNRMDFARIDGMVMYNLPSPRDVSVRIGTSRVVSGRNVGQSTAISAGVVYLLHF